ncbi:MFS transporter [Streptomyces platensis]|uniref:MFS transporter n=1 Tax=Streptomyces platensis TaxID=58346 RepID=UPI0030E03462
MTTTAPTAAHPAATPPAGPLTQLLAANAGNLAEWYDWLAYAYLSVYFADQIFPPDSDPAVHALSSFGVFAVGFAARPVGGLLFGALSDRRGRRTAMTSAITLMGFGQLAMAVLPTYDQVGIAAPFALVFVRLAQGLSVGGEFAVSAVFSVELAPAHRRGLYSSLSYVSANLGQLLAAGIAALLAALLSTDAMRAWGWRAGFAIGALICVSGWWIRRDAVETQPPPGRADTRPGLFEFARTRPREALLIVGMTLGGTVTFYTWTTFLPTYAELTVGFDPGRALLVSTLALAFFTLLQPLAGLLADRIGRRPLMLAFGVGFTVLTVPLLRGITNSFWNLFLISCAGMALLTGYTAVSAAAMAELFPARVRTSGIGLPYAATVAAFGGTAPYLATALIDRDHADWFGWYTTALVLVSTVVYACMRETRTSTLT